MVGRKLRQAYHPEDKSHGGVTRAIADSLDFIVYHAADESREVASSAWENFCCSCTISVLFDFGIRAAGHHHHWTGHAAPSQLAYERTPRLIAKVMVRDDGVNLPRFHERDGFGRRGTRHDRAVL